MEKGSGGVGQWSRTAEWGGAGAASLSKIFNECSLLVQSKSATYDTVFLLEKVTQFRSSQKCFILPPSIMRSTFDRSVYMQLPVIHQ